MTNKSIPVLDEDRVFLGHVHYGPDEVEAFNVNGVSLGSFVSEYEAVIVVWHHRQRCGVANNGASFETGKHRMVAP